MARRPKPASVPEILSMSALGQKRMLSADLGCPLHPLRADMLSVGIHVCKVPEADLRLAWPRQLKNYILYREWLGSDASRTP
jgi:hypothetical protein